MYLLSKVIEIKFISHLSVFFFHRRPTLYRRYRKKLKIIPAPCDHPVDNQEAGACLHLFGVSKVISSDISHSSTCTHIGLLDENMLYLFVINMRSYIDHKKVKINTFYYHPKLLIIAHGCKKRRREGVKTREMTPKKYYGGSDTYLRVLLCTFMWVLHCDSSYYIM